MEDSVKFFDRLVLLKKATWWQMEFPSGNVIFGDANAEIFKILLIWFMKKIIQGL